ncbi:MAG: hypothetical protein PHV34_18430 [Verrucomicrobiae bacterium]|nr:hypothetical protein [Verrucomicrobiae bacterium]
MPKETPRDSMKSDRFELEIRCSIQLSYGRTISGDLTKKAWLNLILPQPYDTQEMMRKTGNMELKCVGENLWLGHGRYYARLKKSGKDICD